jgi:hypothetical protein
MAAQAFASWQFIAREGEDSHQRRAYAGFRTQQQCEAALKRIEAQLKKKYPDRFPLVGTCEEYKR